MPTMIFLAKKLPKNEKRRKKMEFENFYLMNFFMVVYFRSWYDSNRYLLSGMLFVSVRVCYIDCLGLFFFGGKVQYMVLFYIYILNWWKKRNQKIFMCHINSSSNLNFYSMLSISIVVSLLNHIVSKKIIKNICLHLILFPHWTLAGIYLICQP